MLQISTDKIRCEIANQCLTMEKAAEKAGIKRGSLSRILNNKCKVRLDTIGKIAKALEKRVEDFVEN